MTLQEQLDILQAALDGKQIEYCDRMDRSAGYQPLPPRITIFNFSTYDYRVVVEPEEWWAIVGAPLSSETGRLFSTKARAIEVASHYYAPKRIIKVREVIE